MLKAQKIEFVKELTDKLSLASAVVLVNYMGLSVEKQIELKRALKAVDANMTVVKNTLFKIASTNIKAPSELSDTLMTGPTALVIAHGDPIAPLQVIAKFAKDNQLPELKVGLVEGNFQDTESLVALSKLPGKDALVIQVLGAIASPLYGIVGTLNAPMQKLVYVLGTYSKSEARNPKS